MVVGLETEPLEGLQESNKYPLLGVAVTSARSPTYTVLPLTEIGAPMGTSTVDVMETVPPFEGEATNETVVVPEKVAVMVMFPLTVPEEGDRELNRYPEYGTASTRSLLLKEILPLLPSESDVKVVPVGTVRDVTYPLWPYE